MPVQSTISGTEPTYAPILKTGYINSVNNQIPNDSLLLALIQNRGDNFDLMTPNKTTEFGIQVSNLPNLRYYGGDDPEQYSERGGGIQVRKATLGYKKWLFPFQWKREVWLEATNAAAMDDGLQLTLKNVPIVIRAIKERHLCSQTGNGVLFVVKTNATAGSAVTISVEDYGGIADQELGHIMNRMNLLGEKVHFAATIGGSARSTTADTITAFSAVQGSESITVGTLSANVTAGDVVYLSRSDTAAAGVSPADAYPIGLPGLIDNFGRLATFQGLTAATAASFAATVQNNSGTKVPLDEDILASMKVAAEVNNSSSTNEEGKPNWMYVGATTTIEKFAQTLRSERQYISPDTLTTKGVKPYAGVERDALYINGITCATSPAAQRNSVYLLDLRAIRHLHNGPPMGTMLVNAHDIEDGPKRQSVWGGADNFAMMYRNGSVRRDDISTMTSV